MCRRSRGFPCTPTGNWEGSSTPHGRSHTREEKTEEGELAVWREGHWANTPIREGRFWGGGWGEEGSLWKYLGHLHMEGKEMAGNMVVREGEGGGASCSPGGDGCGHSP